MRLREWLDRCANLGTVHGLEIDLNAHRGSAYPLPDVTYRCIRMIVPMDDDQVQLWTLRKEGWPSGSAMIDILKRAELYDAEVLGHVHEDWAVYDTDVVMLDTQTRWITDIKRVNRPDVAFTFTGITDGPEPQIVEFAPSWVRRIRRLEA